MASFEERIKRRSNTALEISKKRYEIATKIFGGLALTGALITTAIIAAIVLMNAPVLAVTFSAKSALVAGGLVIGPWFFWTIHDVLKLRANTIAEELDLRR